MKLVLDFTCLITFVGMYAYFYARMNINRSINAIVIKHFFIHETNFQPSAWMFLNILSNPALNAS